jgi:hypothetical protein
MSEIESILNRRDLVKDSRITFALAAVAKAMPDCDQSTILSFRALAAMLAVILPEFMPDPLAVSRPAHQTITFIAGYAHCLAQAVASGAIDDERARLLVDESDFRPSHLLNATDTKDDWDILNLLFSQPDE